MVAPVQLLMSHRIRTTLPTVPSLLKSKMTPEDTPTLLENRQAVSKSYCNCGARPPKPLETMWDWTLVRAGSQPEWLIDLQSHVPTGLHRHRSDRQEEPQRLDGHKGQCKVVNVNVPEQVMVPEISYENSMGSAHPASTENDPDIVTTSKSGHTHSQVSGHIICEYARYSKQIMWT